MSNPIGCGEISTLARRAINDPTLKGSARTFALPYLEGLSTCVSIDDAYGMDDARGMLAYALANLATWRGDSARAWKTDARAILAAHRFENGRITRCDACNLIGGKR